MSASIVARVWAVWMLGVGLKPSAGFKVNIDAAVDLKFEKHSVAAVIRNSRWEIVAAAAECFDGLVEVEVAEAKAVLLGLHLATEDDFSEVEVESDALNIIKLISSEISSKCEVESLIHDIKLFVA
ncbi:hypothetical protein ACOSQ2_019201 [Xanthoceras sorbifolium]